MTPAVLGMLLLFTFLIYDSWFLVAKIFMSLEEMVNSKLAVIMLNLRSRKFKKMFSSSINLFPSTFNCPIMD